jgi:hypothetical protein
LGLLGVCGVGLAGFLFRTTENPRVGSSILSLAISKPSENVVLCSPNEDDILNAPISHPPPFFVFPSR